MIAFPNAKINLGLRITGKRIDGYHNLETVFYPLKFRDALEIIQDPQESSSVRFSASGIPLDIPSDKNLCVNAWQLLKQDYKDLPGVKMHLHKVIPYGAGLGGGSSDASFTLNLLNEKFRLGIPEKQLMEYALKLGSDCPFFLVNKPCLGRGRGEKLTPVDLDLAGYDIVLISSGIKINTGWAFAQLKSFSPREDLCEIISKPVETWKNNLINDFEKPVFAAYPELQTISNILYENDAVYVTLSGTGSSIIALFKNPAPISIPELNPDYGFRIL